MKETFTSKLNNFIELTRAYSLPISIFTWFVATCWAVTGRVGMINVILSFFAVALLHLATNLFDDYIDLIRELKKGIALENVTFAGAEQKVRLIKNGTYSLDNVMLIIFILYLIPVLIGVYFTWLWGAQIVAIAFVAAVLCLLYPFVTRWGLGELDIAILFGPLLTYAVYFVITGTSSVSLQWFSLTIGLLNVIVVHVHSLMDWEHDVKRCKRTLCMIFKTKENAVVTLVIFLALAYFNLILLVVFNRVSPYFSLVLLTLPIALELIKSMKDFINLREINPVPKWYYGPMECWSRICQMGTHRFMYRFYLARNLTMFTSLIGGVVYYFSAGQNF